MTAARVMFAPVMAASLTTIAAFFPILTLTKEIGAIIRELPLALERTIHFLPPHIEKMRAKAGKIAQQVDVLLGSDICFWDSMIGPLRRLLVRAVRAGVIRILIADPGRSPFEAVSGYFQRRGLGRVVDWSTRTPRRISGRILVIGG